ENSQLAINMGLFCNTLITTIQLKTLPSLKITSFVYKFILHLARLFTSNPKSRIYIYIHYITYYIVLFILINFIFIYIIGISRVTIKNVFAAANRMTLYLLNDANNVSVLERMLNKILNKHAILFCEQNDERLFYYLFIYL